MDSTKKNGVWTYFYKSGTIEREVFYLDDQSIKEISYNIDGNIKKIREENNYRTIINTFHKNGNISSYSDGSEFEVFYIEFDENGKDISGYDSQASDMINYQKILKILPSMTVN